LAGAAEILVTGAGGYIGGRLVETLLGQGKSVRAAVREPSPLPGGEEVVIDLANDPPLVKELCRDVTSIVHLAGHNEVIASEDPATALTETTLATLRVAESAVATGVRRLIYLSTVHVYGKRIEEGAVLTEELRPEPIAVYAIARLASEHLLAGFAEEGLEVVVLRLTNSVGAPLHPEVDRWTLVVNDLCRQAALDGELVLRTAGVQWRDFVALSDVCEIVSTASRSDEGARLPPGTYNLGSGSPITIRDVAALVQDAFERGTGVRPPLRAPDAPPSRPRPYHVSVDRLGGYDLRASAPIEEAVEETARFCLEHRDRLR
jgi:UDP-glucose 4-epimerase